MHHGDPRHRRADVDHDRDVFLGDAGGSAADELEGRLGRVGLDVHHDRLEPGRFGGGDAILDLFLARGGDQHLHLVVARGRGPEHLEVEVHLVERERDVLVRLALDLHLHVLLALVAGEDHLLGDDGGGGEGERDVADARPERLVGALDRLAGGLDVGDIAVDDRVLGQGLDRVALDSVDITAGLGDLHHLDRRRADVAADERRRFRFQKIELGG